MKNLLFLVAALAFSTFSVKAQNATTPENGAKIEFTQEVHDYGTVKYDGNGYCSFEFKNTGNAPLIISKAQGSCGCTVPEWPKEPIAPGAKSAIKVHYDTKRPGPINKSVTVTSNAVNTPIKVLRIKGTVSPQQQGTSPVNKAGAAN